MVGCLLGGALGDVWGRPWEGVAGPLQFQIPVRPVVSDDTSFTLATCESIMESCGVEPGNVASRLLRWFQAGRVRGVGSSTLKAMRDLAAGANWALAGARGEFAAGNGAAMRIAPLAFVLDPTNSEDHLTILDVCRITHHNDEAYIGALAVVLAIRSVLTRAWHHNESFLAGAADHLPDSAVRDRIQELLPLRLPSSKVGRRFGATGHVIDTVPLALHCAQSIACKTLEVVLARAISIGGVTDTIASIAGQVAGAVVGSKGVPHELVSAVEGSDEVIPVADEFADRRGRQFRSAELNP